jgi:hypothetical protein
LFAAYGKAEFFDNDDSMKERRRMLSDGASQLSCLEQMVEQKFDIVCDSRFSLSEPKFLRIYTADPVFKLVGINHEIDDNGYLGLRLSQLQALWACKVLTRMGINSFCIPEKYKNIVFSIDSARKIAEKFIFDNKNNFKNDDLEEAEFFPAPWILSKMTYGFIFQSKKMRLQGIAPPGVTVSIDKVTGEVWDSEKFMNAELAMMILQ